MSPKFWLTWGFSLFVLSPLVFSQTYPVEVDTRGRVASIQLPAADYTSWIDNDDFSDYNKRLAFVTTIYEAFEDDFDFIFLVSNEPTRPASIPYFGKFYNVTNATDGIGLGMFDVSGLYGSDGMLKGVMHLPARNLIRNGPSLHEIAHNWANHGIPTESVSGTGTGLTSFAFGGHWGFTGGSNKGQLGGFDQASLVDNGGSNYTVAPFGTFANGGNSVPYTELELYLMGMIPVGDVSDFDVFSDITAFNTGPSYTFTANTRTTYTPTDLVNQLGARNPTDATSQKDFKLLTIVVTPAPLTQAEWDEVDTGAAFFGLAGDDGTSLYNFWEATGGRGTMETGNLSASLPVEFIDFTATRINDKSVYLSWATAGEQDNDFFSVQRSQHGQEWEEIGRVDGFGTSTREEKYSYRDNAPARDENLYRLAQTDFDGTITYSAIRSVMILGQEDISVYPQPATDEMIIDQPGLVAATLFDAAGRVVMRKTSTPLTSKTRLKVDNLLAGNYLLRIQTEDGRTLSRRVTIVR